ncbi:4-galactosyl-N-acetylglucosaminide 3-alpha-L-fucosyltransferase 9-like [Apostichopus japonicus]|uniref:4-galactosyl-N-acetylglucosaminide 3-alpha-L-fucosyltransferase 9-like n=1 Tax=Stichopus japonicus TaxID=307972 RepID=UPI003AB2C17C
MKTTLLFIDKLHFNKKRTILVILLCTTALTVWKYDLINDTTHPLVLFVRRQANNVQYYAGKSSIYFNVKVEYDFVAFKKKPGWHFVVFPCHYICRQYSADVTVRFTTNASGIIGADAVFFTTGPMELEEWEALHRYRSPGQVWIFTTQEPAAIIPDFLPPKVYRYNTYNWSFTFHSTSDIHGAYGWYTPHDKPRSNTRGMNWYQIKPKFACWISSRHCEGLVWDRTKFVKDLNKFIPIDMYGVCGNATISRNRDIAKGVLKKYKFHVSLENSCCSEYLSEKVWNALQTWESVPIVLGGTKEEYDKYMPPHSYIHADDYKSMEELANYILVVGRNESLYNSYFDWRNIGTVQQQSLNDRFPVFQQGACKVVEKFEQHKRSPIRKSFDPYGPHWFGSCYRCGEHSWIQDYNFWGKRLLYSKSWEDNRTLYWM